MTVVTTHYRYKRPPKKRKAVVIEVPAVVGRKRSVSKMHSVTETAPANDDRKPSIVTAKSKRRRPSNPQPMELPASRKPVPPVEREVDDYKRLKAAMTRRLRGE